MAKDSSSADTALNLNITTDLLKNDSVFVSTGVGYTVLSTLGLEQNLVSNTWGGAHSITGNTSSRGAAAVNTATDVSKAQSKLYTEVWWAYGNVTKSGSDSINLTVEGNAMDYVDLGLYVTSISNNAGDLTEVALRATKSFGSLDAAVAIINDNPESSDSTNYAQAYLTLNF